MDPIELLAAEIVAATISGRVIQRDVRGAARALTVDFDVELPSGELVALEVTRLTG